MFETLDKEMESGVGGPGGPYSYTDKNPNLNHLRNSPTRAVNSRQSPGRNGGNHTDSEILSSPTQVLYATISADKHKHPGNDKSNYNRMSLRKSCKYANPIVYNIFTETFCK